MKKTICKSTPSTINSTILIALMLFALFASTVLAEDCGVNGAPPCTAADYGNMNTAELSTTLSTNPNAADTMNSADIARAVSENPSLASSLSSENLMRAIGTDKSLIGKIEVLNSIENRVINNNEVNLLNNNPEVLSGWLKHYGLSNENGAKIKSVSQDGTIITEGTGSTSFNKESFNGATIQTDGSLKLKDGTIIAGGSASLENEVVVVNNGKVTLPPINNDENGLADSTKTTHIKITNGGTVNLPDGSTITIKGGYLYPNDIGVSYEGSATIDYDSMGSRIFLDQGARLQLDKQDQSQIYIRNEGENTLPVRIINNYVGEKDGVIISNNNINMDGNYKFTFALTYLDSDGTKVGTVGNYQNGKVWLNPASILGAVNIYSGDCHFFTNNEGKLIGEGCSSSNLITANAVADVTGQAGWKPADDVKTCAGATSGLVEFGSCIWNAATEDVSNSVKNPNELTLNTGGEKYKFTQEDVQFATIGINSISIQQSGIGVGETWKDNNGAIYLVSGTDPNTGLPTFTKTDDSTAYTRFGNFLIPTNQVLEVAEKIKDRSKTKS